MNTPLRRILAALLLFVAAATPLLGQSAGTPELDWYGYVKLDASWDEALVDVGNFARWVVSPDTEDTHDSFTMTARQTRLGFRVSSTTGDLALSARWEADFYAGVAENKNNLQLRHAYLNVAFPSGWSILAGQTSDVISPLVPTTLNYTVAWWAGNVGYRRPQLRVTGEVKLGKATLLLQGAAARTIGDDFAASDPGCSGTASGIPTFQGRAGLTLPVGDESVQFGAYAHRGEENIGDNLGVEDLEVESSSVGGYAVIPLGPVTLSGEAWMGTNMDDYFGGIGHGVARNRPDPRAVDGEGGWAQAALTSGDTRFNAGFGIDNPDDEDLCPGARTRNFTGWGNVIHDVGGGLQIGLEYSYWKTEYTDLATGTSSRVQGSLIYSF